MIGKIVSLAQWALLISEGGSSSGCSHFYINRGTCILHLTRLMHLNRSIQIKVLQHFSGLGSTVGWYRGGYFPHMWAQYRGRLWSFSWRSECKNTELRRSPSSCEVKISTPPILLPITLSIGRNNCSSVTEWDKYHGIHTLVVRHWDIDQRHSKRSSKYVSENRICDPKFSPCSRITSNATLAQMKIHCNHRL